MPKCGGVLYFNILCICFPGETTKSLVFILIQYNISPLFYRAITCIWMVNTIALWGISNCTISTSNWRKFMDQKMYQLFLPKKYSHSVFYRLKREDLTWKNICNQVNQKKKIKRKKYLFIKLKLIRKCWVTFRLCYILFK